MISEKKLKTYMQERVIPLLHQANDILREKFRSALSLKFGEPQMSPTYTEFSVDIYPASPQCNGEKVGRFSLVRWYEWRLAFYFHDKWDCTYFRTSRDDLYLQREFMPFALASYAYVWSNILIPLDKHLHIPPTGLFNVIFSHENSLPSIFIRKSGKERFSVTVIFQAEGCWVTISVYEKSLQKFVPYGDEYFADITPNFAKSFLLSTV